LSGCFVIVNDKAYCPGVTPSNQAGVASGLAGRGFEVFVLLSATADLHPEGAVIIDQWGRKAMALAN
jgi:hypothetical protein